MVGAAVVIAEYTNGIEEVVRLPKSRIKFCGHVFPESLYIPKRAVAVEPVDPYIMPIVDTVQVFSTVNGVNSILSNPKERLIATDPVVIIIFGNM